MGKKKSPKTEAGRIQKTGMLLSQFIRSIALEQTELIKDTDGEDRLVSKAEAVAQWLWKEALGYIQEIVHEDGTKEEIVHQPDKWAIDRIWDRMEGRAPLMNPEKKDRRSIADRVSEQGKKRSNKIAESSLTS